MKKEMEDFVREDVPQDLRARILKGSAPILESHREAAGSASWLDWLLRPQGIGMSFAAACAVVAIVFAVQGRREAQPEALSPLMYEAEMLKNADMLLHLEELEKWEKLKRGPRQEWHKTKS